MTIHDFDWGFFWDTLHEISLAESGMIACFVAGRFFSVQKMLRRGTTEGVSAMTLFFAILGGIFGVFYKLLVSLDVNVLLYLAFLVVCAYDLAVRWRLYRMAVDEETRKLMHERRHSLSNMLKRGGKSGGRSGSESDGEVRSHSRSGRRRRHSRSSGEPRLESVAREPLYSDPLEEPTDDAERNS